MRTPIAAFFVLCACNPGTISDPIGVDAGPVDSMGPTDLAPMQDQMSAQPPNIVLIIADDVGIAEIGSYKNVVPGATPGNTPVIDALAKRGVQFNQMWATPACSPTRATLYTGRYTFRTGVGAAIGGAGSGELQGCEVTLPKILKAKGYSTALFGKWHLGTTAGMDSARQIGGFGHHSGAQNAGIPDYYNWTRHVDGVAIQTTTYATTQNVNDALAWIGTQKTPWMAVLAFNAAHAPFHKPPADLFQGNLDGVTCTSPAGRRMCYLKMLEAMDTEIGRLLRSIDTSNTWIFFLGDNGTPGEVMSPNFDSTRAKFTVYQMGLRVPFVVTGPQIKNPGSMENALVNSTDLYATIAELANASSTTGQDAKSLMPYLGNQAPMPRTTAYAETFRGAGPHTAMGTATLRNGRTKIIEVAGQLTECYDLVADPEEKTNLIAGSIPAECSSLHTTMEASHLAGIRCP